MSTPSAATTPDLRSLLEALNAATSVLAGSTHIPTAVADLVDSLEAQLHASAPQALAANPYLLTNLFAGAYRAEKALRDDDQEQARRGLRVALEQVRHSLRDITENRPFSEETPVKEVLANLVRVVSVPQPAIAGLLGVSTRQLQRWIDPEGSVPAGEDESRVRIVAQLANQLRHSFTGPGVLNWFNRRHPALRIAPMRLLDDSAQFPKLMAAAASSRAMTG
jgi:hypothetical protein